MWSDNETETDFLNYSETAEIVSEVLKQTHLRPISVGVFGGWGVGKSSLLRMVKNDIVQDKKNVVLHFDAWLFQGYDDARAALLQKIGDTLFEKAKGNASVLEKVTKLYRRIDKLRVLGLVAEGAAFAAGMPTFGVIARGVEGVRDLAKGEGDKEDVAAVKAMAAGTQGKTKGLLRSEDDESPPKQIEKFREELQSILVDLDCTLFVFIDNLDRCLPQKAIHTLEAVRLFLFMERTAFVIAADEEMIRLAVAEHYKVDGERLVTDYLDKLIQIPVRVPKTGVAELRAFLILLLTSSPLGSASGLRPEALGALREYLIERLRLIWQDPFPEIDDLLGAMASQSLSDSEQKSMRQASLLAKRMSPLLVTSARVSGNPRIVKRMLNTMRMRQMTAQRRGITLSEEALAKLVLFERCAGEVATNDLMRLISGAPEGKVELLKKLEAGDPIEQGTDVPESWVKQEKFIDSWVLLDPLLGDLDLRPAAYLSRETQPVFSPSAGLSVIGERAVQVLANATRQSDPSTTQAVAQIVGEERLLAMESLIGHLSNVTTWNNTPKGWSGAMALAEQDGDAAKVFATFIRSRGLAKLPAWMTLSLKDKDWWDG